MQFIPFGLAVQRSSVTMDVDTHRRDVFSVSGIVHYGKTGSSKDSMSFCDVSVPKLVAYMGAWTWKGTGGKSIYEHSFKDENFKLPTVDEGSSAIHSSGGMVVSLSQALRVNSNQVQGPAPSVPTMLQLPKSSAASSRFVRLQQRKKSVQIKLVQKEPWERRADLLL